MRLLPSLRFGSDRWWLPRDAETSETLTRVLLSHSMRHQPDPTLLHMVSDSIRRDPSLFVFTALHCQKQSATIDALSRSLIERAATIFAHGDCFLNPPSIGSTIAERWSSLRSYFSGLPRTEWMKHAHLWLEVTGPQVPKAWKSGWPEISCTIDDRTAQSNYCPATSQNTLQTLARTMQHYDSLDRSFDRRLNQCKMSALKQVAYGLSHEINNPLANISTRAQQLLRDETDDRRKQMLQRIVNQVYRAHEMIADLMFYANPLVPSTEPTDLSQVTIAVTDEFTADAEDLNIRLETEIPVGPMLACVDREMFGEALRVLIRNALEAVGHNGTIVVSVAEAVSGAESDCTSICIHVADSGPGLSRGDREHAFDPYFSGREAGRGLGLGLCRAYRIAKLHHAEILMSGGPSGCVVTMTFEAA